MTTAVVPAKTLDERISARIHESIGDLVTEEDLKAMVARGIEKALFEPRQTPRQYGGYDLTPSIVDRCVADLLRSQMDAAVNAWLKDNPDRLDTIVRSTLQNGIADVVARSMDNRLAPIIQGVIFQMQNNGMIPRQ